MFINKAVITVIMKVKFLGTAGYIPTESRHTSCVMLPEEGMVLDAGTGFFRVKDNIQTKKLNILLSHYHPDHTHGLTFMLGAFYSLNLNISIYGHKGINKLENKLSFPVKFKDYPFSVSLKKIEEEFSLGDVVIKTKLFPHSDQVSAGYRLEKEGKSLCYLTDLVASDDEVEFVKNTDLLVHECNFNKDHKEFAKLTFHSYTAEVASIAKKSDVKSLALFHVNPLVDEKTLLEYVGECREIFKNTFLPEDNQEVVI